MHSLTQQQRKRLDACAGGLSGKLDELRELHARIEDLCNSAKELLQSFSNEDARFRAEFKTQIEGLERFKDEIVSIDALRDRLRVEQEKVADYERRIDKVQAKIEKQKEMEVGKKRVSWRMRLLWGFSAMVVILWLLATAGGDYEDTDNVADDEPIKLLPPALRADRELEFSLE
ncbi:hypothetical protein BZA05DRAFT_402013 [Tricharina praecox]|uniref:uncharacterized protein n=1 Tax=Tricharina praecox TaxID=43433 RepID=UPI0022203CFB|nr:uncharacterized protein BZA05DRAFT_402013 [Tricharina praecox]KAI5849022.1 hypothetical protein BZA05DRAFT_402013 [Tricharina praecox]